MVMSPEQFGGGFQKPPSGHPQQGTLFRAPKPTTQWPRGYSPERMAEVRDNVDVKNESKTGSPNAYLSGPHGTHRVYQALARSTAPMDEAAPNAFTTSAGDRAGQAKVIIRGGLPGYSMGQHVFDSYGRNEVRLPVRSDPDFSRSLMHEMGHNASYRMGNESATELGRSPRALGQEEAFADDYARTHDRPDPRDPPVGYTGVTSAYESRDTWKSYTRGRFPGMRGQAASAHRAYMEARQTPLDHDVQNVLYKEHLRKTQADMGRGPNWEEQLPLYHGADLSGEEGYRWSGRG